MKLDYRSYCVADGMHMAFREIVEKTTKIPNSLGLGEYAYNSLCLNYGSRLPLDQLEFRIRTIGPNCAVLLHVYSDFTLPPNVGAFKYSSGDTATEVLFC